MTTRPVLAAVDTSDDARAALVWAVAYAQAIGAPLVAVHALGMLDRDPAGNVVSAQGHRSEITQWTHELVASISEARGVAATTVVRDGEPVPALLAEAERIDALAIVVGRRGAGRSLLTLGSTSEQLARCAPCALVIVPGPES